VGEVMRVVGVQMGRMKMEKKKKKKKKKRGVISTVVPRG
jgi:hypothetical protein